MAPSPRTLALPANASRKMALHATSNRRNSSRASVGLPRVKCATAKVVCHFCSLKIGAWRPDTKVHSGRQYTMR